MNALIKAHILMSQNKDSARQFIVENLGAHNLPYFERFYSGREKIKVDIPKQCINCKNGICQNKCID